MRRRSARCIATVVVMASAASCGGGKRSSTTTSPVPDVIAYSKLDEATRTKRVRECQDLTTVYGGVLNALTTRHADQMAAGIQQLDALQRKVPDRFHGDLRALREIATSVQAEPANVTKLTSKEFLDASNHVQGYIQKVCDFTT